MFQKHYFESSLRLCQLNEKQKNLAFKVKRIKKKEYFKNINKILILKLILNLNLIQKI